MKNRLVIFLLLFSSFIQGSVNINFADSILESQLSEEEKIFIDRLKELDVTSPMDLAYNKKVTPFIKNYIEKDRALISNMQGLSSYYFNIFEPILDKYELPLELKYLAIVESSLNPKARSSSGATGLWQFMYLTGKQYGLEVGSYIDDRQDPLKSTEAACQYFLKLYEMFGDWNLVLAAYNGGPGYIQRKINTVGTNNFWELQDYLRQETRNYVPTFIAMNYAMNYAEQHEIPIHYPEISLQETDTIVLQKQIQIKVLEELTCMNTETIHYLNPSFKKGVYPVGAKLILNKDVVNDFLLNETRNYQFIEKVDNKEILIDEERVVYRVKKGDYLGKIAQEHDVHIFEIKEWNNLKTTHLDIGEKLVLFVKTDTEENIIKKDKGQAGQNEYVVQKGDTLWGIAQKLEGVSVWKLKSINNLESDHLKPGTKIILPSI